MLLLVSRDLSHFFSSSNGKVIATITTKQVNSQHYSLILEIPEQIPLHFDIRGDMWQLDARFLQWDTVWGFLGIEGLYRFERLSGRYRSSKDEAMRPRTLYDLWDMQTSSHSERIPFFSDFNHWLTAYTWLPGANLLYGGSTYVPMEDGAEYTVLFNHGSFKVQAENSIALNAISNWR